MHSTIEKIGSLREPLFEELWTFLKGRGFTFQRPLNFSHGSSGRIVQMDALFTRREG